MNDDPDEETGRSLVSIFGYLQDGAKAVRDVRRFLEELRALKAELVEANLLQWAEKVKERLRERPSASVEHVPPSTLVSIVEAASEEGDEGIRDLWAGLMANAMDPASRQKPRKLFISILRSFDPMDAALLRFLAGRFSDSEEVTIASLSELLPPSPGFQATVEEIRLSLHNLARLGCFEYEDERGKGKGLGVEGDRGKRPLVVTCGSQESFRMTPLAWSLLRACGVDEHGAADRISRNQN